MYSVFILLKVMLLFEIGFTSGYRILGLFPHPAISHFKFFHPIMRGLAERGHDVIVVSYFPDKNPHVNYKDFLLSGQEVLMSTVDLKELEASRSLAIVYQEFFALQEWGFDSCKTVLSSPIIDQVLEIHKSTPFDLVVTENFNTDCMLGVIHKLNVPFIGLSSCALMPWHYDRVGMPDIPSYIPSEFVGFSDKMSFYERLFNWFTIKTLKLLYRLTENNDNQKLREKFGPGIPDVRELGKETSLIFVNQHYSLSGPRPLPPSVIEVGGIHIEPEKPLPNDIKLLLDGATHGVIYISWGSLIRADTLPMDKRVSIVRALERLPQLVLWKWENTLENKPKNIHLRPWLPQRDILCHPNVKVFMSHGGMMGTTEAAYCGVPVLVTPIYGDQFLNGKALENRGMGVMLDYDNITEENIYSSLKTLLEPSVLVKAKKVSMSYKNRQISALETALWWCEHVIVTRGALDLKSHSIEMSWIVYYSIDVILVIFGSGCLILYIFCSIIYFCCLKHKKSQRKINKRKSKIN